MVDDVHHGHFAVSPFCLCASSMSSFEWVSGDVWKGRKRKKIGNAIVVKTPHWSRESLTPWKVRTRSANVANIFFLRGGREHMLVHTFRDFKLTFYCWPTRPFLRFAWGNIAKSCRVRQRSWERNGHPQDLCSKSTVDPMWGLGKKSTLCKLWKEGEWGACWQVSRLWSCGDSQTALQTDKTSRAAYFPAKMWWAFFENTVIRGHQKQCLRE